MSIVTRIFGPHTGYGSSNAAWRDLSPADAADVAPQMQVVDVRQPAEFVGPLGHIPGADSIPLGQLPSRLDDIDPAKPLLVVCRSGGRSARACTFLADAGFEQVFNLDGGMTAWNEHGLPTSRGVGGAR